MKKFIAIVISVLMLVSLAPAAFAETPEVSVAAINEALELEFSEIDAEAQWVAGEDGVLMTNFNQGVVDCTWKYKGDFTPYNAIKVKFTTQPFDSYDGNNIIFAIFVGENECAYYFQYYPIKGSFDIGYFYPGQGEFNILSMSDMMIAESDSAYFPEEGKQYEAVCVIGNGVVALFIDGALVCWAELQDGDAEQEYPLLYGWSWQGGATFYKYELLNVDITTNIEEETEEETEAQEQTDAQTEAQEQTEAQTDAQTEAQTDAETKAAEKGGCKSSVAVASVAMVAALGCCLLKKKEN